MYSITYRFNGLHDTRVIPSLRYLLPSGFQRRESGRAMFRWGGTPLASRIPALTYFDPFRMANRNFVGGWPSGSTSTLGEGGSTRLFLSLTSTSDYILMCSVVFSPELYLSLQNRRLGTFDTRRQSHGYAFACLFHDTLHSYNHPRSTPNLRPCRKDTKRSLESLTAK